MNRPYRHPYWAAATTVAAWAITLVLAARHVATHWPFNLQRL